jgi:TonB family protein
MLRACSKCMIRALLLLTTALLYGQRTDPRLIHKVDPAYSDIAAQARISGTVLLSLTVSPEGLPTDIRVVRSLGYGLDEKAIEALRLWRFEPATDQDGTAVPVDCSVEIRFRLSSSPAPASRASRYTPGLPGSDGVHRL